MHENSPSGMNWHARRLFGQDVDLESLTKRQWQQVAKARHSYLKANALKAVEAKRQKAPQRLRDKADLLEARLKAEAEEQEAAGGA